MTNQAADVEDTGATSGMAPAERIRTLNDDRWGVIPPSPREALQLIKRECKNAISSQVVFLEFAEVIDEYRFGSGCARRTWRYECC